VEDVSSAPAPAAPDPQHIADKSAVQEATAASAASPAKITLAQAKAAFLARCEQGGYVGKLRPLLTELLDLEPGADITRNLYLRALACSDRAWRAAVRRLQPLSS